MEVLDSILRTVDPGQISQKHEIKTLPLIHHPPFIGKPNSLFDSVPRGNVSTTPSLYNESNFRVVLFEKGAERKPPNEFDMNLWTNIPGVIKMENLDPVQRIDVKKDYFFYIIYLLQSLKNRFLMWRERFY